MSALQEPKKIGSYWSEEWANSVAVRFKRPQYDKMKEIKAAIASVDWADMADQLHAALILGELSPRMRELLERALAIKTYKV